VIQLPTEGNNEAELGGRDDQRPQYQLPYLSCSEFCLKELLSQATSLLFPRNTKHNITPNTLQHIVSDAERYLKKI
jgi:hypothetical protein